MHTEDEFQFLLIRHGYSLGNRLSTLSGQSNVPLLEKGRKELERLSQERLYPVCDRNYSSDMDRCVDTFNTLYAGRATLDGTSSSLREINFGKFENLPQGGGNLQHFFSNWLADKRLADEESFIQIAQRMSDFLTSSLRELHEDGLHSLCFVSHSVASRVLLVTLGAFERSQFSQIHMDNGQGYALRLSFDGHAAVLREIKPLPFARRM
ncbi:MAG: histidine phosphatase family protein [Spirochaetia bacterium]|jgi:broad specificity phosphatase PhoE|nr:histidine phosphatase family protein [Spirochaetia bacterium]